MQGLEFKMPIKAYLFDAQGVDHPIELDERLAENIGENQLLWINASDIQEQELQQVGASLEIPDKVLGTAFEPTNRPHIETAGNLVQLTVIAPLLQGVHFKALTLHLIAGDNYVIAIHQGTIDFLNQ